MRDGGRGVFAAEEGTEDREAGRKDANVAFDSDPDSDVDRGVGDVGDLELRQKWEADDACDADAG